MTFNTIDKNQLLIQLVQGANQLGNIWLLSYDVLIQQYPDNWTLDYVISLLLLPCCRMPLPNTGEELKKP